MRRTTRETIRRRPDYERDPEWDVNAMGKGRAKTKKTTQPHHGVVDGEYDPDDKPLYEVDDQER